MEYINSKDTIKHSNSEKCTVYEYPFKDTKISLAVAEVLTRYPDKGFAVNHKCTELGYVLKGSGFLVTESKKVSLSEGDAVCIPVKEKFYWEGDLTLLLPTAPKWDPEQHELVHTN